MIWAEQVSTKPTLPFVTIKTGNINRTRFAIIDDEGRRYYPCSTLLEINLYTKGKPMTIAPNVTGNYANTATSDLQDFLVIWIQKKLLMCLLIMGWIYLLKAQYETLQTCKMIASSDTELWPKPQCLMHRKQMACFVSKESKFRIHPEEEQEKCKKPFPMRLMVLKLKKINKGG